MKRPSIGTQRLPSLIASRASNFPFIFAMRLPAFTFVSVSRVPVSSAITSRSRGVRYDFRVPGSFCSGKTNLGFAEAVLDISPAFKDDGGGVHVQFFLNRKSGISRGVSTVRLRWRHGEVLRCAGNNSSKYPSRAKSGKDVNQEAHAKPPYHITFSQGNQGPSAVAFLIHTVPSSHSTKMAA